MTVITGIEFPAASIWYGQKERQGYYTRAFNVGFVTDVEFKMTIYPILYNTAFTIPVKMRDLAANPATGLTTITVKLKKDGQTVFTDITANVTKVEVSDGFYNLTFLASHADTVGKGQLLIYADNTLVRDDIVIDVRKLDTFTQPYVLAKDDAGAALATAAGQAVILAAIPSATAVRDAVLNAARSGFLTLGSIGEGIALSTSLLQGNFMVDTVDHSDPNGPISQRLRCWVSAAAMAGATPGGSGAQGAFATFLVTTTYVGPNKVESHKVVQQ